MKVYELINKFLAYSSGTVLIRKNGNIVYAGSFNDLIKNIQEANGYHPDGIYASTITTISLVKDNNITINVK